MSKHFRTGSSSGGGVGKGSKDGVKSVSKKSKKAFKKSPAHFVKKIGSSKGSSKVVEKKGGGKTKRGDDKKAKVWPHRVKIIFYL